MVETGLPRKGQGPLPWVRTGGRWRKSGPRLPAPSAKSPEPLQGRGGVRGCSEAEPRQPFLLLRTAQPCSIKEGEALQGPRGASRPPDGEGVQGEPKFPESNEPQTALEPCCCPSVGHPGA